mmetsp:Transcript_4144/g.9394  ORF Transcript_4144/g.9394 Transcript_4144/m.9394 type:complete len:870 (-) Transcript_4144:132-2741(-)
MVAYEKTTPVDPGSAINCTKKSADDSDADPAFLDSLNTPSHEHNPHVLDQSTYNANANQTNGTMESSKASGKDSPAAPTNSDASTPANDASSKPQHSPEKLPSAPEPPRWRFVNEAKKSMGYSSLHAGSYIKGRSSNELGAKYVAPDISLYSPKEEKVQPKQIEFQLATNKSLINEDIEVGKLVVSIPSQNVFPNQNIEVGKLQINEASPGEIQREPTGAGLPKSVAHQKNESRNSFKEWETNLHVGPKKDREHDVWYDGKIRDSYTVPNSEVSSKTHGEVGKMKFHGTGSDEEAIIVGEFLKSNRDGEDGEDGGRDDESEDSDGNMREGDIVINSNRSTNNENEKDIDGFTPLTEAVDEDSKKKRRCLYLLLLLLLALVATLGVMYGKNNRDEAAAAMDSVEDLIVPPVAVVNETSVPSSYPSAFTTNKPSLQPSTSPSIECPLGTKPLSINQQQHSLPTTVNDDATWKIIDACSGEIFAQCIPCSHGNVSWPDNSFEESQNNSEPTLRRLEKSLVNITECLPINNEYVVQFLPAEDSQSCCGFDPITSVITYDNVVIEYRAQDGGLFGNVSKSMNFGERETPCKSESPTLSPTISASLRPSFASSHVPSSGPTFTPSVDPSHVPSRSPSLTPTLAPTTKSPAVPACSTEQEFNLCLAVDMSGSVCNGGAGAECVDCQATFIPIISFVSECRDSFVSEDTCCNNFANVKEFSSLMVNLLGDLNTEKSFSIVQFATDAQLISGLASADQTVPVIDQLDYTGGLTNHASAIQICQQTLPSEDNRKKFIMLVTDGVSSEPGFDPEGAAEAAATSAKSDGTFIIPVFISPNNDWSALSFMRRLSSDGEVFDVTDFDSLNSLQDRLINQVSCS